MAKGRSKMGGSTTPQTQQTPQAQPVQATAPLSNTPTNPVAMDDAYAAQLRQMQDASYDPSTRAAIKMYISNSNFDGQRHSLSQSMNYLLDNGVDLNNIKNQTELNKINRQLGTNFSMNDIASMAYTDNYMSRATHSIGKDVILQRGAHDRIVQQLGISDYTKLNNTQLQKKLVGQTFTTTSYMSTSYDQKKNPFLSSSSGVSGGREVVLNIKAGKNTKMILGAHSQSEVVLDKGTNFRITSVKYTGATATPRGGRAKPQIMLDIETY